MDLHGTIRFTVRLTVSSCFVSSHLVGSLHVLKAMGFSPQCIQQLLVGDDRGGERLWSRRAAPRTVEVASFNDLLRHDEQGRGLAGGRLKTY